MSTLQQYKCPCCDGEIEFDSASQQMKCPYCDAEFDVSSMSAYLNEIEEPQQDELYWESADASWQEAELSGLRTYVCRSCGGEILTDENTVATCCPFCDNPVVVKDQVSGALRPNLVPPFKLAQEAAKKALRKHYSDKRLLPKVFKDENHIDEIKGIYVPFWLFDADAHATVSYLVTREEKSSDLMYYYTRTKHYRVVKGGSMRFRNVPVDASAKLMTDGICRKGRFASCCTCPFHCLLVSLQDAPHCFTKRIDSGPFVSTTERQTISKVPMWL